MYIVNKVKTKIEDYLMAVHNFDPVVGWKFDGLIEIPGGKKVGLFDSSLNSHLNNFHKGNDLFVLSFHANRFNPHEKNLFILFFEIYDRLVHKETDIFLVKFHTKPYLIRELNITGIPAESVYTPSFHFQKDLLLIDAEKAPKNIEELALLNLKIKVVLKKEIEKLALFYFFERLIHREGFVASFCTHLFKNNGMDINYIKANTQFLPFLVRNLNKHIFREYNKSTYTDLVKLLNNLEIDIKYIGTNEKFNLNGSKLLLAPVLNEVYLKLFEYFIDSDFPFICNHLLHNIGLNNPSLINEVKELSSTI